MVLIDNCGAMRKRRAEDAAPYAASRGDDDDRYILQANTLAVLLPSTIAERRRGPPRRCGGTPDRRTNAFDIRRRESAGMDSARRMKVSPPSPPDPTPGRRGRRSDRWRPPHRRCDSR